MKKKGLIISTLVMVVVLIAALTTTTFAWFSSTATATIDDITLETQASEGLQIATYYNEYYTDALTLNGQNQWTSSNVGYGPSLSIDESALAGISLFGTSGDGVTQVVGFTKDATGDSYTKNGPLSTTHPDALNLAVANVDFIAVDLAIQTTKFSSSTNTLYIDNLNIKATGAMAAASRIAIYTANNVKAGEAEQPAVAAGKTPTYNIAKVNNNVGEGDEYGSSSLKLLGLIEPFAKSKLVNGSWTSTGTANAVKYYNGNTVSTSGNTAYASSLFNGTFTSVISSNTALTKETLESATDNYDLSQTSAEGKDGYTFYKLPLGTFTADYDVIYLRIVIWFEGEDTECVTANAGTGLTVGITFTQAAA